MIEGIDHLVIAVSDLEAAQRRYVSLLGRSPSWSGEHPGQGTANVLFRLENLYVELLAPEGAGTLSDSLRAHLKEKGEGPYAVALSVLDADAAVVWLREQGLSPSAPAEAMDRDALSGAFRRSRNVYLPSSETHGVGLFLIEHLSDAELLPPALAIESEAAAVSRVDHVVINTAQPERAIGFYGQSLGIRLALDRTFEKRGMRLLFFRLGGTTLEFSTRIDSDSAPSGHAEVEDSLWGIAYQVPDAAAANERLEAAGFSITPLRPGHKPGTRVFSLKEEVLGVPTLIIEPVQHGS